MHSISREAQDDFALRSHELAAKATANGHFEKELLKGYFSKVTFQSEISKGILKENFSNA